jgi:hypothetical protein
MGTESGIATIPELLVLGRITPLASGAGTFNATVAAKEPPPITLVGNGNMPFKKGVTVNVLLKFIPAPEAEINIDVAALTPVVLTGNVAVVAPAGMVTVGGTLPTVGRLLAKFSSNPPGGAGLAKVIVPVDPCDPAVTQGLNASEACGLGPLNGARPPGNGWYNGSPIFMLTHFRKLVFRIKASPTFAPFNRSK